MNIVRFFYDSGATPVFDITAITEAPNVRQSADCFVQDLILTDADDMAFENRRSKLKISITAQLIALAVSFGCAQPSLASQDQSAKPGGVFQLKPGTYVEARSTCTDPANAAIMVYDGKGIATSSTHACEARIVKRNGKSLSVTQSCIDAGAAEAPRVVERFNIAVENALEFTISKNTRASTYRYCPPRQLPQSLR